MNNWKRQHPVTILVYFINALRQLIITMVAVVVIGNTGEGLASGFYFLFFMLILGVSGISAAISWWKFEYSLFPQELRIRQGLIFRKNRFIRKERVQSIDFNAHLVQRLFGLVEVRIETAGGGSEPEFRLVALTREEAVQIKRELREKTSPSVADQEQDVKEQRSELAEEQQITNKDRQSEPELPSWIGDYVEYDDKEIDYDWDDLEEENIEADYEWKLTPGRLAAAAMTASGVGLAATFLTAIVSQVPQFLPAWMFNAALSWFLASSVTFILSILVMILFVAWVFTSIGAMIRYGKFTLKKWGNEIHISRGLLEKRQLTIKANRVTAVRIVQNPIRQLFGYYAVYIESAGGGTKEEDFSTILIPMATYREIQSLLDRTLPEFSYERQYAGLPGKSLRRYMIKLIVPSLIFAGAAVYFLPLGWLAFILPLLGALLGYIQYRAAGLGFQQDHLQLRYRVIDVTELLIPKYRIQAMESNQNPLQRLDDLYTIQVSVLSSIMGKSFQLRHIHISQRETAFRWYSYLSEKSHYQSDENKVEDEGIK